MYYGEVKESYGHYLLRKEYENRPERMADADIEAIWDELTEAQQTELMEAVSEYRDLIAVHEEN